MNLVDDFRLGAVFFLLLFHKNPLSAKPSQSDKRPHTVRAYETPHFVCILHAPGKPLGKVLCILPCSKKTPWAWF